MHHVKGDCTLNGNIGVGKSTLIERFKELGYRIFDEPVDEWKFLLARIYKHGEKHLLPLFQWRVIEYYARITEEIVRMGPERAQPIMVTRSPDSAVLFILKNIADLGEKNARSVTGFITMIKEFQFWRSAVNFYLYQPASRCFENMNKRETVESNTVPLKYLEDLEAWHDDFAQRYAWEHVDACDLDVAMQAILLKLKRLEN